MPKISLSESALHDWVHALTFQQQALLMTGTRGPDGCNKHNPAKGLVRFLRGAICKPAGNWDGGNNNDFMWGDYSAFEFQMNGFFEDPDGYPHHFIMHLIHCAEVVAYKHPSIRIRQYWLSFYLGSCTAFHMTPETRQHMDDRLNDFGVGPAPHPAPALIVGDKYRKALQDIADKVLEYDRAFGDNGVGNHCRNIALEALAQPSIVGEREAESYWRCKEPNPRCQSQCDECASSTPRPAPTEQALPEGVDEADYYAIQKLSDWHLKQLLECQTELRAAKARIKELQEWHDSHL